MKTPKLTRPPFDDPVITELLLDLSADKLHELKTRMYDWESREPMEIEIEFLFEKLTPTFNEWAKRCAEKNTAFGYGASYAFDLITETLKQLAEIKKEAEKGFEKFLAEKRKGE